MQDIAPWVATAATIIAACFTASNLGSRITGIGFVIFTIGSIAWGITGLTTDQPALIWTNVVMTILNLFGVYRWLGRQAKLETGAERAADKSAQGEGETLFPASTLTSAGVTGADEQALGTLVDAMTGCRNGTVRYLVVAEGGIAGVGETLRRLDWSAARVRDGVVTTDLTAEQFNALPRLQRDNWPAA